MKFLNALAYWFGAAILSLCLVPLLLVAMMIGLGAWLISRLKTKREESACLALFLLAVGGGGCGRDAAAWWQFPVERREFTQHTPPSPPFAETNAPSADVEVSVGNFSLDARGVTWFCDAGDVLIGGKGPHATTLTWRELRPLLRPSFALSSH